MYNDKEIDLILTNSSVVAVRIICEICCLSDDEKELMRLRYREGLNAEEIADKMAMSQSTLYRRKGEILQKIRMGLDIWGIKPNEKWELTVEDVFDRNNFFCKTQAELVRYFYRNRGDIHSQELMYNLIRKMSGMEIEHLY